MKTAYKFIHFVPIPTHSSKPQRYSCRNTKCGEELGIVQWYPAWKCYCYFPSVQAIYADGCLKDIAEFIGQLGAGRKEK